MLLGFSWMESYLDVASWIVCFLNCGHIKNNSYWPESHFQNTRFQFIYLFTCLFFKIKTSQLILPKWDNLILVGCNQLRHIGFDKKQANI